MRFKLLLLFIWIAAAIPSFGQAGVCRSTGFVAEVSSAGFFTKDIGASLQLVLAPLKQDQGWMVRVSPIAHSDQDWTFPVNMPLRTGESQLLGTGYGGTARGTLKAGRAVRFVLTSADFARYEPLAIEAIESPDPAAAGRYISRLRGISTGQVRISAMEAKTSADGAHVYWARLKFQITVPNSFQTAPELHWAPDPCPKQ